MKFLAALAPLLLLPPLAQSAPRASDGDIANRALLMAAETGRTDLVAFALDHGAEIEARDRRPRRGITRSCVFCLHGAPTRTP
jgi:hypothetical protein